MKRNSRIVIAGIASLALVFCAGASLPNAGTLRLNPVSLTAHAGDIQAEFTIDDIVYRICDINGGTNIVRVVGYTGNGSEIVIPAEVAHTYTNDAGEEVTETVTVTEIGERAFNKILNPPLL